MRLLACLIVAPQRGYDEPAILSYAISSFCPTSADGLQATPIVAPSDDLFGAHACSSCTQHREIRSNSSVSSPLRYFWNKAFAAAALPSLAFRMKRWISLKASANGGHCSSIGSHASGIHI